ncbi:MAG TPA: UbiA family prenyltransferase [Egibacteraceae bacterium]|nr:UbiA family prenyltransferase [Egibacteraceae bacterium]
MLPLLRATHLQPSLAVTVIATALALSAGQRWSALWVAAAVLAGQFSVGWANDWLDAERDRLAQRSDKPTVTGQVQPATLRRAALLALAAAAVLSVASGAAAAAAHLTAVGLAWSYNAWLKHTVLSVAAWAAAFALLPAFVTLGAPRGGWPAWWALAAGGLLGAGAHFANALPDLDDDAVTGVTGLPQRLGSGRSLALAVVLLTAGALVAAVGPEGSPGAAALTALTAGIALAAGVGIAGLMGHRRLGFQLTMGVAGIAVLAFIASGTSLRP